MIAIALSILGFAGLVSLVTGIVSLVEQAKRRADKSHRYDAYADGMAYGAGLDERDRREALRKRLRLDA